MESGRSASVLLDGLPKAEAALGYAERQHMGQRRGADGAPFIAHPIEVGSLLYNVGASEDVIAAGLLHDTIEKTSTTAADLRRQFGPRVTALVVAVSEDPGIAGWETRKAALRRQVAAAGHDALMVFAADKVSKARELPSPGDPEQAGMTRRARSRKLAHYERCAELFEQLLSDSPLFGQLRAELTRLGRGDQTGRPRLAGAA